MPSLGERLAVAYGCEWSPDDDPKILLDKPWVVKRFTDGSAIRRTTPDPENSWEDFGALLDHAFADIPDTVFDALEKAANKGGSSTKEFRCRVVEDLLNELEHLP